MVCSCEKYDVKVAEDREHRQDEYLGVPFLELPLVLQVLFVFLPVHALNPLAMARRTALRR